MVKKSKVKTPKRRPDVIPPESITGYPKKKPCKCPAELLSKTAGGGKKSAS